jgi:hypothetical protein
MTPSQTSSEKNAFSVYLPTTSTSRKIELCRDALHGLLYINRDHKVIKKKTKSEQALQIIGYVVVESYANKCSMHGRRKFVVSNATL